MIFSCIIVHYLASQRLLIYKIESIQDVAPQTEHMETLDVEFNEVNQSKQKDLK